MTENQFLDNMASYQRRFEYLRIGLIRKMNDYTFTTRVRDSEYYKTIDNYAMNIAMVAYTIQILKDFNASPRENLLRVVWRNKNLPGVPDAKINPQGSGKIQ